MKKRIKLTEAQLHNVIKKYINEVYKNKIDFEQLFNKHLTKVVEMANHFLSTSIKWDDLSLEIDEEYDFDGLNWLASYEDWSAVDEGIIRIGVNKDGFIETAKKRNIDEWSFIKHIYVNIYHEMGHGLFEKLSDYIENGAVENKEWLNRYQDLFTNADEETLVEEFGEYLAELNHYSELYEAVMSFEG